MTIEKVYDELYGMIDDLKKQIASAGGSDVTITPALESGTKVADYAIGETEGSLYAPTIPAIASPLLDIANASEEHAFPTGAQLSYTATEDCAVLLKVNIDANTPGKALIDGVIVWSFFSGTAGTSQRQIVYLKSGQVLTTGDINTSTANSYTVIPLAAATQPVTETRKTKKK